MSNNSKFESEESVHSRVKGRIKSSNLKFAKKNMRTHWDRIRTFTFFHLLLVLYVTHLIVIIFIVKVTFSDE